LDTEKALAKHAQEMVSFREAINKQIAKLKEKNSSLQTKHDVLATIRHHFQYKDPTFRPGWVDYLVQGSTAEHSDKIYARGDGVYTRYSHGPLKGCEVLLDSVTPSKRRQTGIKA
jgi:hypothetical protein